MDGPSIDIRNVSLELGATRILDNVSLTIRSGSIHCIVGANGGGKTSLIRSILGQMPHSGTILIHWSENRTTGYVPQSLDFDKTLPLTVGDFIAMTCQRRPVFLGVPRSHRKLIDTALERVGLEGKRHFRMGGLSGGERQRVLFAQALIPEPSLLVLDEPLTGLDLDGQEIVETAITDFAARGGTVVWINHDLAQVERIADAVTYINRSVLFDGQPKEVLQSSAARALLPGAATVNTNHSESASA